MADLSDADAISEPVGLVLSGGGAKGAFEAGVWKAICELGIAERVRVISGTSVGAINAVAIALLRDPDKIRELWFGHVQDILSPNFNLLDVTKVVPAIWDAIRGKPFPFFGIFSRPGLEAILREVLMRPISETGLDVYATALACTGSVLQTFDRGGYSLCRFHLNQESSLTKLQKMLLASAAIPWGFDPVEIDGTRYIDGSYESGGGDNVPIEPILANHPDLKTIYVVRCNSRQVEPHAPMTIAGRRIVEVCPRKTLSGILDDLDLSNDSAFASWSGDLSFKTKYAKRYFDAGYSDGLAALRNPILDAHLEW